jgi:DNA-binding response OmpR family regulator
MKILIADDERIARKVLEAFLLKEKYEVVLAEDGASALKAALTFTEPYIAILDWVMPGLTGPQVCVCLRSPKLKIRPYIIVLSARSDKGDIAAVLDAGADDFLTKPFNQVELLARLRVAGRALHYHADLRQQIGQLEALVQRYTLPDVVLVPPRVSIVSLLNRVSPPLRALLLWPQERNPSRRAKWRNLARFRLR